MPMKTKSSTPAPKDPARIPDAKPLDKPTLEAKPLDKPALDAKASAETLAEREPADAGAPKKKSGGAELAAQIVAGTSELGLAHYARALEHENPHTSSQA